MDSLIIRIADVINLEQIKKLDPGLFYGSMGLSLFYYHFAKITGYKKYETIADELIDRIFADINILGPCDFEKGLAGIGWGIEYLVQNKFVDGNTDEILEEIDNKIFRLLNEETINSFELTNGLTGYLVYLLNRLRNSSPKNSMAKQINRELLILVINKIYDLVTPQFSLIVKDFCFDLFWRFPVMLFTLTEVFKMNLYNQKIICMIKQWLPNLEEYIPSLNINRLYIATILMLIHAKIHDYRLEKQAKLLLYSIDFESLLDEIDYDHKSIRFGLPGFIIIMSLAVKFMPSGFPNYRDLYVKLNSLKKEFTSFIGSLSFSPENFNQKQTMYGLSEGIAGLGLLYLSMPD